MFEFHYALDVLFAFRITRMLHMGNGVVVGPQACGKMTLIRLSAFIMNYNAVSLGCSTQNCKRVLHNEIQQILLRTVLKDERLVIIISSDIVRAGDVFTEIHDLLLVNEESIFFVTEFFGTDGAESVYNALKRDLESSESSRTQRACYNLFFARLCKNLRLVQVFSDIDAFCTCASRFPIILKDNIIFFQEWDPTALDGIAKQCITEFDRPTGQTRDNSYPFAFQFLSYSFLQAVRLGEEFCTHKPNLIRASFKSFLVSLSTYQKILNSESKSLQVELLRYDMGLDKLKSILQNIAILEENLAHRASEIEDKKHAADFLVDSISNDQATVHEQVEKLQIEASKCDQLEMRCALQEQDCLRVLAEADPAILAAEMALNTIDKKDIVELKSLPNPPSGVEDVTAAILAVRGELGKRDWNSAKHMMRDPAAFILELKGLKPAIDEERMSASVIESARQYLALEHFNAAVMLQKSKAIGGLCDFVVNLIAYYDIMVSLQPRKKALELAKEELISASKTKASLSEKIQELRARISELEEEYMRVAEAKHVAIREAEKLQKQVTLAQRFITALTFEKQAWSDVASRLRSRLQSLPFGILISTAFVSYAGTFTPEMRSKYLNDHLIPYIENNASRSLSSSMQCNPTVYFADMLENDAFVKNDLSRDETFLENILITHFSVRYPLLIDPHLSAVNWIRSNEKNRSLKIELLTSPTLKTSLLNAVQFGWSILVEGVETDIVDREFLNLISKRQFKKDSNFVYFIGDKACEHHPAFNLFMLSKQANPHFSTQLQDECTVIDFALSDQGIENRILEFVVNMEQITIINQRVDALKAHHSLLATKNEIDNAVLMQLSVSAEDIIHDVHQIHFFENSRKSYAEALGDLEDVRKSLDNLMKSTEIYRSVAQRATVMFLLLREMRRINELYQFSLDSFMGILLESVGERHARFATPNLHVPELLKSTLKSPYHRFRTIAMTLKACIKGDMSLGQGMKGQLSLGYNLKRNIAVESRNIEMLGEIMKHVHDFSYVALQEKHRLLFASMLMFRMLLLENKISFLEFNFLTSKIEIGPVPEMPVTVIPFLPGRAWASACSLQKIPALRSLTAELEMNADRWNIWYNSNNSESLDLPGKFKHISRTHRYLIVLALRPDRAVPFLKEWISDEFGSWFLANSPYSAREFLKKCLPSKPVIFLLNRGLEFNARLLELNCARSGEKHVIEFSLGPSHDSTFINALHKAVQSDSWVLIQNLHRARPNIFSFLSYIVDESAPKHAGFRCVLTAAADEQLYPQFPLMFIECCLKISINPPMGMKACLIAEWENFHILDSESSTRVMHFAGAKLLFTLSVFHSFLYTTNRFVSPNAKDILHTTWFGMKQLMMFTEPTLYVLPFMKDSSYALEAMNRVFETLYCSFNLDKWGKRKCVEILWQLLEDSDSPCKEHDVGLPALKRQQLKTVPISYLMFVYEVERLWFEESATELGLGPNSEWHAQTSECMTLLSHLSTFDAPHLRPNADTPIKDILADILNQLPANINMIELRGKVLGSVHPWGEEHTPFGFVLMHECSRMNELLNEIRSSAISLNQMLDGEVWSNEFVQNLMSAINAAIVPQQWSMFDFPTLKGLGPWFVELLERVEKLMFWADHGTRARSIWISGLFCPALQFTATLQVEARKQKLPLEHFFVQYKITGYEWDTVVTADDTIHGVFIHGMFLDGARWDSIGICLADQRPKERYPKLPVMHIQSSLKHGMNDDNDLQTILTPNSYDCPVYRTCTKESIFAFSVPLESGSSLKKWVISDVCLLLSV
jgi:dynein heavy chain